MPRARTGGSTADKIYTIANAGKLNLSQITPALFDEFLSKSFQFEIRMVFYDLERIEIAELGSYQFYQQGTLNSELYSIEKTV